MPDFPTMTGDELRRAREQLELSQPQMAEFLCVHKTAYARWEADPSSSYSRPVPAWVCRVVGWLLTVPGFIPPEWPK